MSPWAPAMPLAASIPSEPQASSSTAGRAAAEPALDPDPEDRQPDRDDEEVADVDVGEGGGEEAPPLALERHGEAADGDQRGAARLLTSSSAAEPRITAIVA